MPELSITELERPSPAVREVLAFARRVPDPDFYELLTAAVDAALAQSAALGARWSRNEAREKLAFVMDRTRDEATIARAVGDAEWADVEAIAADVEAIAGEIDYLTAKEIFRDKMGAVA